MTKRRKAPATPDGRAEAPREAGLNARMFPPDAPVDVPQMPKIAVSADARSEDAKPTEADAGPVVETKADDSWADNTQAAPYKKTARTSIF